MIDRVVAWIRAAESAQRQVDVLLRGPVGEILPAVEHAIATAGRARGAHGASAHE